MQFKSFHWLSRHGLYHARACRQVKPKVVPFVLTKLSWEDLSVFWGVFRMSLLDIY